MAAAVANDLRIRPVTKGWTNHGVWFESSSTLLAVVGSFETRQADILLSHGLFHALNAEKSLALALPTELAEPTRRRLAWIDASVDLWVYDSPDTVRESRRLTKQTTIDRSGNAADSPILHLSRVASERTRPLSEWATRQPHLTSVHRRDVRAWTYNGQRVLAITGSTTATVVAGVNAKSQPALSLTIASPLDSATLKLIQDAVEDGVQHAAKGSFGSFAEHRLQQQLRTRPNLLLLEDPVLREVPAWRPVGGPKSLGRGYIDLVALDSVGDLVLVETKLGHDPMLVIQGLDYWMWAKRQENRAWLLRRMNVGPQHTETRLLFAIGAKNKARPSIDRYSRALLRVLDQSIRWQFGLITSWHDDEIAAEVLAPDTAP